MINILRRYIVGVNNDGDLVYVQAYSDENNDLGLNTFTLSLANAHSVFGMDENNEPIFRKSILFTDTNNPNLNVFNNNRNTVIAPFIYVDGYNKNFVFKANISDLKNEIENMSICFHVNALYDLYNSYYRCLNNPHMFYDEIDYVSNFNIGCKDYLFLEPETFLFDKFMDYYKEFCLFDKNNIDILLDYKYGNGSYEITEDEINDILGSDRGFEY